jgi:hypothetical protein
MKKRERERDIGEGLLAAECGAFLLGTLAEHWDERGVAIPVWAWTNLLAHGTVEMLTEAVAQPNRFHRAARSWGVARSHLADEVLEFTELEGTLLEMQAEVLVPLELEMAFRPEVNRWSASRWFDTVDIAIRSQTSTLGL